MPYANFFIILFIVIFLSLACCGSEITRTPELSAVTRIYAQGKKNLTRILKSDLRTKAQGFSRPQVNRPISVKIRLMARYYLLPSHKSPSANSVSRCPVRPAIPIVMRGRRLIAELRRHRPPCRRTIRTVMISRGLIAERRRPRASTI